MQTLWLYRPLLNTRDIFECSAEQNIKKMLPPEQLHLTLATVRKPVDVSGLVTLDDIIFVPEGHKQVQIFGYTAKAIAFGHPDIKARHEELAIQFPQMDHAKMLRPHVTIMRGGKMPRGVYEGPLHFGPEILSEFNEELARNIPHMKVADFV